MAGGSRLPGTIILAIAVGAIMTAVVAAAAMHAITGDVNPAVIGGFVGAETTLIYVLLKRGTR